MGCPKLQYDYTEEQKFPSALRVAYSRYRENYFVPDALPQPKITYFLLRIELDKNGEIIRVDSYALNNPLKYTDPTGEVIPFAVIVGIGAAVGGGLNLAANWNNVDNFWDGAYYFGVGAAIGAGAVVGGAALAPVIGTGAVAGAAIGAGSGFALGYANTGYTTGDWGKTALMAGGKGALIGGVTGGLIGGIGAAAQGNNFWTGASPGSLGPSWNFGDAEDITTRNFWEYGSNRRWANVERIKGGQQYFVDKGGNQISARQINQYRAWNNSGRATAGQQNALARINIRPFEGQFQNGDWVSQGFNIYLGEGVQSSTITPGGYPTFDLTTIANLGNENGFYNLLGFNQTLTSNNANYAIFGTMGVFQNGGSPYFPQMLFLLSIVK